MGTVNDYTNELSCFYDKVKELEKAVPSEFGYKLSTVLSSYHEMFSRFCPFKVGDKVRLTKTPQIKKGSGWNGCQHFLVEGAIATIKTRNWQKGQFVFQIEFDEESWIDSCGVIHPIAPNRRHVFGFGEDWLTLVEDTSTISTE